MARISVLACVLFTLLLAACSGGAGTPAPEPQGSLGNVLPSLGGLGPVHQVAATSDEYTFGEVDKLASQQSLMVGTELVLQKIGGKTPWTLLGANFADRTASTLTLTGTCENLFVFASDFSTGRWKLAAGPLNAGGTFNLPAGIMRADGSTFLAFICPRGCFADVTVTVGLTGGTPPPPEVWNIMVWIAGDNNLADMGVLDLEELEAIGSTDTVRLFAGYDIDANQIWGAPPAGIDEVHFIKIVQDAVTNSINTTGDPANLSFPRAGYNSANPAHIREFVDWVNTNFPATHNALVLWNHGDGWIVGDRTPSVATGAERDAHLLSSRTHRQAYLRSQSPRALYANRAASAVLADDADGGWDLTNNATIASALTGLHFDLLAFDACNMGQLEALYDYRMLADVLVASEVLVPGTGFPYSTWLNAFAGVGTQDAQTLGMNIVDQFFANYDQTEYVTLASFDAAAFDSLASALADLAADVTVKAATEGPFLQSAITAAFEPDASSGGRDLKGFLDAYRGLTADTAIQAKIDTALAALAATTLEFKQYAQPNTNGLAAFLPSGTYFDTTTQTAYGTTQFAIDTGWLAMLQATGVPGGGGGGGYDVQADWVEGDFLQIEWADVNANVDINTWDPTGEFGGPWFGDTATLHFSQDSLDSSLALEWAQLKVGAVNGDYDIDIEWYSSTGNPTAPLDVSIKLYDSSMQLKQDLGVCTLLFDGDYYQYARLHFPAP